MNKAAKAQVHQSAPKARADKTQYDPHEQDELISLFAAMLMQPTKDGGVKRMAGKKPSWKVDRTHVKAIFSHLGKWADGEAVDKDSGVHPLIHCAWRCLAQAWYEDEVLRVGEDFSDAGDGVLDIEYENFDC